ncbi:MAG: hypothetical protein ACRD30_08435 [Bryobacteraceae bacterium]
MKRALMLLAMAAVAMAQTRPDVLDFFESLAHALSNAHSGGDQGTSDIGPFLDKFDPAMPGYAKLRNDVEELAVRSEIGSAIEVVSDQGNDRGRTVELDWVLEAEGQRPRRKIVKCTIERKKKDWKITSFDPIGFFAF